MHPPTPTCGVGPAARTSSVTLALRRHAEAYRAHHRPDRNQARALHRLLACRTATLGGHLYLCTACGWQKPVYNSCRDRHCPQCQGATTDAWLQARRERMLPVPHFQVVCTLPAALRPYARHQPRLLYDLLLRTAASVLQQLAAQRLGACLGLTAVLHTWTSDLAYHPHVHLLVTAGGLALDGPRWVPSRPDYLFPHRVVGQMLRGRFLHALIDAVDHGDLDLPGEPVTAAKAFRTTVRALARRHTRWVVHIEPPDGRPVDYATRYLARYVKRVALADARIRRITATDVTFTTRRGELTLPGPEFVRRFLLHVLPHGFRKVRHYGLYAPGSVAHRLPLARRLLDTSDPPRIDSTEPTPTDDPEEPDTASLDRPPDPLPCPACGAPRLHRLQFPAHPWPRGPP